MIYGTWVSASGSHVKKGLRTILQNLCIVQILMAMNVHAVIINIMRLRYNFQSKYIYRNEENIYNFEAKGLTQKPKRGNASVARSLYPGFKSKRGIDLYR